MFDKNIVGGVVLWWYLSFACNIFSQLLLRRGEFSPLLLTSLQSLTGCVGACLFSGVSPVKLLRKFREEHSSLSLKIGLAHFVGNVCTNIGLSLIDVSAVHTVKAAEPIITAFLCVRFSVEPFSRPLLVATLLVSTGVALFSYRDLSSRGFLIGVVLTFGSNVGFAARNLCIKLEQKEKSPKHSAAENFILMSLISFVVSVLLWSIQQLTWRGLSVGSPSSDTSVLTYACAFHFFYNSFSLFALQNLGLLSHAVANSLKRFVIIVAASIFFGSLGSLSAAQVAGSVVTCVGAGYFGVARAQAHAAAPHDPIVVDEEVSSPVPLSSLPLRVAPYQSPTTASSNRVLLYLFVVFVTIAASRSSMQKPTQHSSTLRSSMQKPTQHSSTLARVIPTVGSTEEYHDAGVGRERGSKTDLQLADPGKLLARQLANIELAKVARSERKLGQLVDAKRGVSMELSGALEELLTLDPAVDANSLLHANEHGARLCDDTTSAQIESSAARIAEKEDLARAEIEQKIKRGRYSLGSSERVIRNEDRMSLSLWRQSALAKQEIEQSTEQIVLARTARRSLLYKKVLFFTGAGNMNLGDDEMPAAWLAHIASASLNWIPYFAIQQSHLADWDSPERIRSQLNKRLPIDLFEAGFTLSYFMFPVLIIHRHDAEKLASFDAFDAMIVGGGGMIASGGYADFHSHDLILSAAAKYKRPMFIAATGAFYPQNTLSSALLQQARIISVRDHESMVAMEKYASTTTTDEILRKTRLTGDLIATAPQKLFLFPSLEFLPLPFSVPIKLQAAVEQMDRDQLVGGGKDVKVSDDWRKKFSVCWILKDGHQEYLHEVLQALVSPASDFAVLIDSNWRIQAMARKYLPRRQMFFYRQNASDVAWFMQQKCRMVVSMALHGTIYAMRLGIPAFGLKAGKIEGALRHFGGEELVQACSTSKVVPSLAALVRCHKKYTMVGFHSRLVETQDTFVQFLRDADESMLTVADLEERVASFRELKPMR